MLHPCMRAGRVPAMFNGCVGVKATVGRISTTGVVPACASLDCVSVFAQTVADAATVIRIAQARGLHMGAGFSITATWIFFVRQMM